MRKSAPMGKDCVGDDESKAFLERVCYSSSPDAVFTGSTKCLSIIPVVIEREMNVSEREGTSWGKQQCSAVRGGERPGFFSLEFSGERGACVVECVQLCLPAVAAGVATRGRSKLEKGKQACWS